MNTVRDSMSPLGRPAQEWLAELERLRSAAAAGGGGQRTRTLADVAAGEPGSPPSACLPTSPRSVEACLRLGIDPATLAPHTLEHYLRRERSPELAKLAYDHDEGLRAERLVRAAGAGDGGGAGRRSRELAGAQARL